MTVKKNVLSTRYLVVQAFLNLNSRSGKPPPPPAEMKDARERAFFTKLLQGLVRNDLLLEAELTKRVRKSQKLQRSLRAILKLGMFELLFVLSIPPRASIHQAGWLAGKFRVSASKPLVNGFLRQFQRELDHGYNPRQSHSFEVSESIPDWMFQRWTQFYGLERARNICKASNQFPGLYVCSTFPELLEQVKEEFYFKNLHFERHPYIEEMLLFNDGHRLFQTDGFLKGRVSVVDPSNILFLQWAEPMFRGQVLDVCAAPGIKAMRITSMTKVKTLYVNDISWLRLKLVQENFMRIDSSPSGTLQSDGQNIPFPDQTFDTVLLDVPCSSTGTLFKNPDIKWTASKEDLLRHIELQRQLLKEGARLVRREGILIYSTCSIEQEENQLQVKKFLETNPQFKSVQQLQGQKWPYYPELEPNPDGFFQSLPSQHWGGGFAAAFRLTNKI